MRREALLFWNLLLSSHSPALSGGLALLSVFRLSAVPVSRKIALVPTQGPITVTFCIGFCVFLLWAMIMNVGFCQSSIPLNSQKQRRKSSFLCLDLSLSFPVIPVLRFRRRNCFENKFVIGINAYISSDFHCFCRNGFCI